MNTYSWWWGGSARAERDGFITCAPAPKDEVKGQIKGNLIFIEIYGRHPEELPRQYGLRALPLFNYQGTYMFAIFVAEGNRFLALHVAVVEALTPNDPTSSGRMPPLPEAAWRLARSRLDNQTY